MSNAIFAKNYDSIYGENNYFLQIKEFEIEQGFCIYKDKSPNNADMGIAYINLGLGIMSNFEIGLKAPYIFMQNADNGLADISVFQRFKILEESDKSLNLGAVFDINLPTGSVNNSDKYDSKKVDIRLGLFGGKDLSVLRLFGTFAVNFRDGGDYRTLEYDLGANIFLTKQFKLTAELTGDRVSDEPKYFKSESYLAPGIIFNNEKNLVAKVSIPIGLNSDAAEYGVNLSFSHSF